MESESTRQFSRDEIAAMKLRGEVRATPADAPEIALDDAFWQNACIVETRPKPRPDAQSQQ